jgi:hypothetical protein
MHIYLDLDGVVVDLESAFENYYFDRKYDQTWQHYEKTTLNTTIFKKIYEETDPYEFWLNLNPLPGYMELIDKCVGYVGQKNISILSAPTNDFTTECALGKMDWVKKGIPYNFRCNIVKMSDKKLFSGKDKILIDDMSKNIIEWTMAGGIGILHTTNEHTFQELKNIFGR